jgi:predicted phage terminase large subunit-like protein
MARKTRQVVTSEWYQARWGHIQLLEDATKIDRFSNNHGGGRAAITVRQQVTGMHAQGRHGGLVVVDDPNRPDDTPFDYEQVNKWYSQTLPTRFGDLQQSQICIVQQRISNSDLSAYVLDSDEGYTHVCLPMEYDPARKCVTPVGEDWRVEPGELLSPKRNTSETVARLKEVFKDPRIAQAQLNQNPILEDGNIFKVHHFTNRYDQLPLNKQFTISCDLTFTGKESSDFAVCQVWANGLAEGKHYLADQIRRKMGFTDTVDTILFLAKRFPNTQVLIEKSANGFAVIDLLKKAGLDNIHEIAVGRTGKEQRAATVSYLFDRGEVLFPQNEPIWFEEYQRELTGFPGGTRHDDQVDATVNYLSWVTGNTPLDLASAFKFAGELARKLR